MASRMKEDEKNEKIIRGLLKLPANRKCINCNSLGPQYVCTNFWTFICTNCSGLHREFTHRVKSISMAKFTSQEVAALQQGGNERAREIYFKEWDPHRHSVPDNSNHDRLRDFIKHVYVDRRYSGERSIDRPPRVKGDREDSNEDRKGDSYSGGSRSPAYEETYERSSGRPSPGRRNDDRNFRSAYGERSPGYDHGEKRSPGRFEVVDNRRRDERYGNGVQPRRFEDRRFPDELPKPEGRSPNHQKDIDASSPPMARPVREILITDVASRISEPPKVNGIRSPESVQIQSTASTSSSRSNDHNIVEPKVVTSGSLIDFDADPQPLAAAKQSQPVIQQSTFPTANDQNWASFGEATQERAPQVASNAGTLESLLANLSAPGPASFGSFPAFPAPGVVSFSAANNGRQPMPMPMPPQQLSLFPNPGVQTSNPPLSTPVAGALSNQGPFSIPIGESAQAATKPPLEIGGNISSQPPVEAKPSGRKALPEDIFAALYPSAPATVHAWHAGPHVAMGYGAQYPASVNMPPISRVPVPISTNPFDTGNEPALAHASTFPSLSSLQGALPNVGNVSSIQRSSSLGAPTGQWMPQQQPYLSAMSPSPYMVPQGPGNMPQQVTSNMFPMVYQGPGGFGNEAAAFSSVGMSQQSAGRSSYPGTPNSFAPVGGNPFG